MTEYAELNDTKLELARRYLTLEDQQQLVLTHLGYLPAGEFDKWTDAELSAAYMTWVAAVDPPVADWGYKVEEDPAGEWTGTEWRQKWLIVQDGTLAQLKARAAREVHDIVVGKLNEIAENKGSGFIFARMMLFDDHNRFQHDGLTDPAEHPMLNAYRITQNLQANQVDAAVNNLRKTWHNRAANILLAEKSALDQINDPATDTPEELKAIIDSAEVA